MAFIRHAADFRVILFRLLGFAHIFLSVVFLEVNGKFVSQQILAKRENSIS